MSMGAIFARGSCRALRWMALVGVVFALGAGTTAAQVTITPSDDECGRGGSLTLTVGGTVTLRPESPVETLVITGNAVAGSAAGTVTGANPEDLGTIEPVSITLPAGPESGEPDVTHTLETHTFAWTSGTDPYNAEDEAVSLEFTVVQGSYPANSPGPGAGHDQGLGNPGLQVESSDDEGLEEGADPIMLTLVAEPVKTVALANISLGLDPNDPRTYTLGALTRIMHEEPILGETQEPPCGTNVVFITF